MGDVSVSEMDNVDRDDGMKALGRTASESGDVEGPAPAGRMRVVGGMGGEGQPTRRPDVIARRDNVMKVMIVRMVIIELKVARMKLRLIWVWVESGV